MNYHPFGAGSPLPFVDTSDTNMDYAMDQSGHFNDNEQQQILQPQPPSFGHSPLGASSNTNQVLTCRKARLMIKAELINQSSQQWPTSNIGYARPAYQQHWSVSTNSSTSSYARSSGASIFSDLQNRASTISTDSSVSSLSNISRSQCLAQAEHHLNGYTSPLPSYAPSPVDVPSPRTSRRRNAPRIPAPEKDYYTTCVSRTQRARRANTVQKYFCTICKEPFVEKADWKRHEETYQERPEEFQCNNCPAKYFLDKDFVNHHVQKHACAYCNSSARCSDKRHVQEARRHRKIRTGWGCGFCQHFSTNWVERCNHIAHHFDHEGKTMADWCHSLVIYSLLQRPALLTEWNAVLESINRPFTRFAWNEEQTGRVEGYPDSSRYPRLQDALEYFTPKQNAAALARKAYEFVVVTIARENSDIPPPVPAKDSPKDYRDNHKASLQDIMKETESWTQFVKSIIHDDQLPTNVTRLEDGALNDHYGSWFDPSP
jgi:hypothetical protein